jgi:hypothetical protein
VIATTGNVLSTVTVWPLSVAEFPAASGAVTVYVFAPSVSVALAVRDALAYGYATPAAEHAGVQAESASAVWPVVSVPALAMTVRTPLALPGSAGGGIRSRTG